MTCRLNRLACWLTLVSICLSTAVARAAEPKDAEPTDPDFKVQGEYLGTISTPDGNSQVGVQVVALGHGKFEAVGYIGGLPGEGWEKSPRLSTKGELKDGVVEFKGQEHTGTLKDGVLTITIIGGIKLGELKKVERKSPTLGAKPPEGAIVLFDGASPDKFEGGRITEDGLLVQGATSKQKFQSGTLHIEFRLPFMPEASGQGRGNSGCYLQGRYETQVLDSFGLEGKDNECGGIYSIKAPDVNMCFPPLAWQTYDIDFTAGKYEGGKKIEDATMTVKHNGVLIQNGVKLTHATTAAPVGEGPEPGPIYLQDHGNPVRFRNIWFVEKK
jgi:hypothetical protein